MKYLQIYTRNLTTRIALEFIAEYLHGTGCDDEGHTLTVPAIRSLGRYLIDNAGVFVTDCEAEAIERTAVNFYDFDDFEDVELLG